jgi:type IV secretory pathway VirD2 relaxase
LGHRQAFAWIDEWHGMTEEDVREYESKMQAETNEKVLGVQGAIGKSGEAEEEGAEEAEEASERDGGATSSPSASTKKPSATLKDGRVSPDPVAAVSAVAGIKSWFTWS